VFPPRHLLPATLAGLTLVSATRAARADSPWVLSFRVQAPTAQPLFVLGPGGLTWSLPLPGLAASGRTSWPPPTEELRFAPLRGVGASVAFRRCEGAVCGTEPPRPAVDQLFARIGVISLLASAFLPEGKIYAFHSDVLGGLVRFTPTTFNATGAGLRVWGTF